MKILHYREFFSPLAETFIYDLIMELKEQGADNYVLTFNRENPVDRPFENIEIVYSPKKTEVERLRKKIIGKFIKRNHPLPIWELSYKDLKGKMEFQKPDIVHSHFGQSGVFMAQMVKEMKIPHVVSFHGKDAFKLTQRKRWNRLFEKLNQDKTIITCVSEYMKSYLSDIFPEDKIKVIHVGKKIENYPFQLPKKQIKNWLSIGRLVDKKGHEDTIKAFEKLIEIDPEQKLKIIGTGKNKQGLQRLIKDLNLEQHVFLLGALPHDKVINELKKTDAFVLASKTAKDNDKEGIPTVLMEAQAMGKPCVSTFHSGISEVFTTGSHFLLAEEGNIKDIIQKMQFAQDLSVKQLKDIAVRGRKNIEQNFNVEIETEKLIKLYQSLLK